MYNLLLWEHDVQLRTPITKLKPELYSDAQRVASFFARVGNYLLCGRAAVAFKMFNMIMACSVHWPLSLTPQSTGPAAFFVRVRVFDSTTNNLVVIVVLIAFVDHIPLLLAARCIHFLSAFFPTRRLSCEHSVALRLWMIHLLPVDDGN